MIVAANTPSAVTAAVRKIVGSLGAEAPRFVDVIDDPHRTFGFTWRNVNRKVSAAGGSMVLGFTIWEMPGVSLAAEPHAVWSDPEGTLWDIAPRAEGERRILFAPHPTHGAAFERHVGNEGIPMATDRPTLAQVNSPLFDGMLLEEELAISSLREVAAKFGLDVDRLRYVVEVASKHDFAEVTEAHHAIYRQALREN